MQPYNLPSLSNGEYMFTENGFFVRVKITETTDNLLPQDRATVLGFRGRVWQVDEAGLPEVPNEASATYYERGLTILRERVAENESYLVQDINRLAATLVEKGLVLCATNARTATWIPKD